LAAYSGIGAALYGSLMKISRRHFFRHALGAATLVSITTCPYAIQFSANALLAAKAAHAQGKGNGGNGNAGGNGGNGGGGNGNGKAGQGSAGGNANSGRANSRGPGPTVEADIAHENGMRETIQNGRYEMRDAQGRTIVNRPATALDYLRFKVAR
jgi:hypothetical protein